QESSEHDEKRRAALFPYSISGGKRAHLAKPPPLVSKRKKSELFHDHYITAGANCPYKMKNFYRKFIFETLFFHAKEPPVRTALMCLCYFAQFSLSVFRLSESSAGSLSPNCL